jgi:hypothetical protein
VAISRRAQWFTRSIADHVGGYAGGCRVIPRPDAVDSMTWELAIVAATVLAVAAVSRRLTGTSVAPAMVFVGVGVLVGPLVIDEVTAAPAGQSLRVLAEATLAVVLFADDSRIKPRVLRREYAVPLRLPGVRLPLTIALGAVLAAVFFEQLSRDRGDRAGDTPRAHRMPRWAKRW